LVVAARQSHCKWVDFDLREDFKDRGVSNAVDGYDSVNSNSSMGCTAIRSCDYFVVRIKCKNGISNLAVEVSKPMCHSQTKILLSPSYPIQVTTNEVVGAFHGMTQSTPRSFLERLINKRNLFDHIIFTSCLAVFFCC
jgi:hypothetical protein